MTDEYLFGKLIQRSHPASNESLDGDEIIESIFFGDSAEAKQNLLKALNANQRCDVVAAVNKLPISDKRKSILLETTVDMHYPKPIKFESLTSFPCGSF